MTAFAWLLDLAVRSTVVLAVALVLAMLLGRTSAVGRHRLLTLAALGLLLLPALPGVLPRWELSLLGWVDRPASEEVNGDRPSAPALAAPRPPAELARVVSAHPERVAASEGWRVSPGDALGVTVVLVWLIGVLVRLAGLGRALRREGRLRAASSPLAGPWLETLAEARRTLAVRRPVRLLACGEIQTPLTGGWPRAAVLLPPFAALWPEDRRLVVLQHELVHVVRSDALRHVAWGLAGALYWFHPLARRAERLARVVGEQACDETVVRLGTRPSAYARHLLEIAESVVAQPPAYATVLPMIDRSQLERRLQMILDPNRPAHRGRAVAALCLALLAATVIGVAGAAAPPRSVRSDPTSSCLDGIGVFNGHFSDGSDDDFGIQHGLGGGGRLCARVHGPVRFDDGTGAIRAMPPGSWVAIETRQGSRSQRVLITAEGGLSQPQWWVNGASRPVDDGARAWLTDALEVVAGFRAIGAIQGKVGSLQGEIGSIQGEIGSLHGQIGSIQGRIGSAQGKIGSIHGERGSIQGAIGSHQGAIGSLQGGRWDSSDAEKRRIDEEIRTHEAAIRKLEAELESGDLARRLAEAEAELQASEQSGRRQMDELRQQIEAVRADERIGDLQRVIADIHAEERIEEIERRMKPALDRLKAHIDRLGR